jgi:hypothetical protein
MSSFFPSSQGASSKASGTRVVFPAPGDAVSNAFRPSVSVRQRVGSTSSIGSVDMIGSVVTRQTVADQRTHEKDRNAWQAIAGPRRNLAALGGIGSVVSHMKQTPLFYKSMKSVSFNGRMAGFKK